MRLRGQAPRGTRGRAICKALQIAPSTYYARRSRPESARAVSARKLGEKIESIHAQNYGIYGARTIHKEPACSTVRSATPSGWKKQTLWPPSDPRAIAMTTPSPRRC